MPDDRPTPTAICQREAARFDGKAIHFSRDTDCVVHGEEMGKIRSLGLGMGLGLCVSLSLGLDFGLSWSLDCGLGLGLYLGLVLGVELGLNLSLAWILV